MSKEEKMMILQMVAEGKITPEQGAELLKAVGEPKTEAPANPSVPWMPSVPAAPVGPAGSGQSSWQSTLDHNIRQTVQNSVKAAEEAAETAAKRAEDFAERMAREGENIGKVMGEGGENLGKMLGRMFGGGWSFGGGTQFEFPEEINGELPAEGEIKVNLTTRNGRVTVDTWDEPGFRLQVIRRVNAANEEEAKRKTDNLYEFTQEGLKLTARTKEISSGFFGANAAIHFALTLPRDRKVDVRASSANGRLTFDALSGSSIKASTANGRIESSRCDFERADLDSANGRICYGGSAGDLTMNTANGRIEGELQGAGRWVASTANGRIDLNVKRDPNAAYEVDASSVAGKVEVTGLADAEVLVNDTRHTYGSRRYRARTRNFESAETKGSVRATTASGRVTLSF